MKCLTSILLSLVFATTLTAQDIYLGGGWGGIYDHKAYMTFGFAGQVDFGSLVFTTGADLMRGKVGNGRYRSLPRHPGDPFSRCIDMDTGEEVPLKYCRITSAGWDFHAGATYNVVGEIFVGGALHWNNVYEKLRPTVNASFRRKAREDAIAVSFDLDICPSPFMLSAHYIFAFRL